MTKPEEAAVAAEVIADILLNGHPFSEDSEAAASIERELDNLMMGDEDDVTF